MEFYDEDEAYAYWEYEQIEMYDAWMDEQLAEDAYASQQAYEDYMADGFGYEDYEGFN